MDSGLEMTHKGIILAGGSGTRPPWTAAELGITLRFEEQGVDEKALVAEDLKAAQQTALLRQHGFHKPVSRE